MWVATGAGTANTLAYSSDGIHWTGLGKTIFSGGSGFGYGVAWNGVMWVFLGEFWVYRLQHQLRHDNLKIVHNSYFIPIN